MELEKNQRLWNLKKIKIHEMCQWLIIVLWLVIVGSALTLLVGLELLIIVGHPIIVGLALLVIAGRFRFQAAVEVRQHAGRNGVSYTVYSKSI
jgi:hypothetical protein